MVDTSLKITYGLPDLPERNIDITELIYTKHTTHSIAYIPSGDIKRAQIFSDPFPNILKSIFITVNGLTTMYTDETELYIDFKNGLVFRENILDSLEELHKTLSLDFGSFQDELPEQKMAIRYLTGNEKVLEIGGNIGRNSLVIASLINNLGFMITSNSKCSNAFVKIDHNLILISLLISPY